MLNFYSPVFVDQLKRGRKTATIRLGDKSRKYKRGQVVWITVGYRHQPREKIFAAVVDDVEVKKVSELSATSSTTTPSSAAARRQSPSSRRSTPARSPTRTRHGDPLLERPSTSSATGNPHLAMRLTARVLSHPREERKWLITSSSRPGCSRRLASGWDAIYDSESWPEWWEGVEEATKLEEGDEDGVGQYGRYVWKAKPLPGRVLHADDARRAPHLLEGDATGELAGTGAGGSSGRAGSPRSSTSGT